MLDEYRARMTIADLTWLSEPDRSPSAARGRPPPRTTRPWVPPHFWVRLSRAVLRRLKHPPHLRFLRRVPRGKKRARRLL